MRESQSNLSPRDVSLLFLHSSPPPASAEYNQVSSGWASSPHSLSSGSVTQAPILNSPWGLWEILWNVTFLFTASINIYYTSCDTCFQEVRKCCCGKIWFPTDLKYRWVECFRKGPGLSWKKRSYQVFFFCLSLLSLLAPVKWTFLIPSPHAQKRWYLIWNAVKSCFIKSHKS